MADRYLEVQLGDTVVDVWKDNLNGQFELYILARVTQFQLAAGHLFPSIEFSIGGCTTEKFSPSGIFTPTRIFTPTSVFTPTRVFHAY